MVNLMSALEGDRIHLYCPLQSALFPRSALPLLASQPLTIRQQVQVVSGRFVLQPAHKVWKQLNATRKAQQKRTGLRVRFHCFVLTFFFLFFKLFPFARDVSPPSSSSSSCTPSPLKKGKVLFKFVLLNFCRTPKYF